MLFRPSYCAHWCRAARAGYRAVPGCRCRATRARCRCRAARASCRHRAARWMSGRARWMPMQGRSRWRPRPGRAPWMPDHACRAARAGCWAARAGCRADRAWCRDDLAAHARTHWGILGRHRQEQCGSIAARRLIGAPLLLRRSALPVRLRQQFLWNPSSACPGAGLGEYEIL